MRLTYSMSVMVWLCGVVLSINPAMNVGVLTTIHIGQLRHISHMTVTAAASITNTLSSGVQCLHIIRDRHFYWPTCPGQIEHQLHLPLGELNNQKLEYAQQVVF